MGKKAKHLCELRKQEVKDQLDSLTRLVIPPRYICSKCARVAATEEWLCKPHPL